MENYLNKLNEKQREAVTATEGPLLVLAGAGSGKTTVLANRIAYILQNRRTQPWNILAITFTNKAANEMRSRIEGIVGDSIKDMWVGTFHSICVRILRRFIDLEGYDRDFIIYDSSDSRTVMKECIKEQRVDEKEYPANYVLSIISNAKNEMMEPDDLREVPNHQFNIIADLYERYRKKLVHNNALDFDDLIMLAVKILKENDDVAENYQAQFQYILVDEYQDTNGLQYELVKILAKGYGNICVVGDDDQSIYKFRGARIENILGFESDYDEVKRIALEENYRSTPVILDAANSVIANNSKRLGKNLWTRRKEGDKISFFAGFTEREEAKFIADRIKQGYKDSGSYSDFAILYRTNMQSRAIEEIFIQERIPYKVLAGMRFYDRKEIKDIIAYLRLIYNYNDDLSLQRIINEPKRKIGAATIDKIRVLSEAQDASNFEIISRADLYAELKSAAPRLKAFAALIMNLRKAAAELDIVEFVKLVLNDSGYMNMLQNEPDIEAQTRIENINEFVNVVSEYASDPDTSGGLGEFLENLTLRSEADGYDENADYVALMTIHSAKGLEFPTVFISGLEEGLFPSQHSILDHEELEEERRLCYVAITRAKNKLYLTRAMSRFKFGTRSPSSESRFLSEIPNEYLKIDGAMNQLERSGISVKPDSVEEIRKTRTNNNAKALGRLDFRPGDRVRHRKFGDGTVIESTPVGNDAIVIIDFEGIGPKRLMAAFAKLEKI